MYRVKSNAVWHSLPGVVAAYQPIAAPDPFAARQNVAHGGARVGVYTAMPGVLPTWSAATGWTFNGSSQYLNTGVILPTNASMLVAFANGATVGDHCLLGSYVGGTTVSSDFSLWQITGGKSYYNHLNLLASATYITTGTLGLSSKSAYKNGVADGTVTGSATNSTLNVYIGCANKGAGTTWYYYIGNIRACLIAFRPFSPAEMWLASRQMTYCHLNPDWDAWRRRRRYYYAPSQAAAAAFQAAWAARTNTLLGGGFD